jgi:type IV pilus assembly protein PilQ
MRAKQSMKELEELQTEYIQVNYAKAGDMEPQVQEFLSERGKISNDPRTNMLIVSDVRSNLEKIKSVVNKLDQPERQVLIEARIVYATDEFSRSLGVNWGALYPTQSYQGGNEGPSINPATGNPSYPSSYNQGQYQKGAGMGTYGVNAPTVGGLDVFGSVAKIAGLDLFTLDAELQLGESQGFSRTISSPRVITLNNEQAEITQGTQIATQTESESGGTTTEYVEAVLSLNVTPQITPDDKLILELEVSDDSPVPGSDNINTKTASTKLIVDDGETLVLGGVRTLERADRESKVPGVGDVPILGWLFKNKYKSTTKNELLIFIRPKIM